MAFNPTNELLSQTPSLVLVRKSLSLFSFLFTLALFLSDSALQESSCCVQCWRISAAIGSAMPGHAALQESSRSAERWRTSNYSGIDTKTLNHLR